MFKCLGVCVPHLFAFDPALSQFVPVPMPVLDGFFEKVNGFEPPFFGISLSPFLIKGVVSERRIAAITHAEDDDEEVDDADDTQPTTRE